MSKNIKPLHIPLSIVQKVEDRSINVKEAYLLAVIDSIAQQRGGDGCKCDNNYLAERVQIKWRRVVHLMNNLIDQGLLEVTYTRRNIRILRAIIPKDE